MTEATPPTPRRRRRWLRATVVVVVVLVVCVVVASQVQLDYYAIQPGDAEAVAPLITVPPARAHPVHGRVMLVDVLISRLSALDYLPAVWDGDEQVVPADAVLGPATPPSQFIAQGFLQMAQSRAEAKAAALRHLGYHVPAHDDGTLVYSVVPGSPASRVLSVGQTVTAVDDVATPTSCAFVAALHDDAPGTPVRLTIERSSTGKDGVLRDGPTVHRTVRLAKPPAAATSSGCPGVTGPSRAFVGVSVQTRQDFEYPFAVHVDTSGIGGPSAGLSMTLGIIDELSVGSLTGGRTVAATGTIDAGGGVGPVGGVAQKTVAAERAGAVAFIVPREGGNYATAKAKASGSLHVYGVDSLGQALRVLQRLRRG